MSRSRPRPPVAGPLLATVAALLPSGVLPIAVLGAVLMVLSGGSGPALAVRPAAAADPPPAEAEATREQLDFFENEIRPLLIEHCYECHSDEGGQEAELQLDSRLHILHGGASGPAAVAGKPDDSLMIEAVRYRTMEMPPNGKLPQRDIDNLVRWVEMGLPWPAAEAVAAVPVASRGFAISDEQRQHWSFLPIRRPEIPTVDDPQWNQHPVDRFLFDAMQRQGVAPNELADRATLLRRVTYDLIGLPPTPEQLADFLADDSPDAWPRVVERLLASPQYGERWGRHWMDVVRYADTAGDASDYPIPDAYKYRDYIIDAFNTDKPYDDFVREQYAGDLLAQQAASDRRGELLTATTHLALARRFGYNDTNFHYFHLTIHDLLDTMGQSLLGLSIGCARCHDHKFEPISAADYYALYGIFSSTQFTFTGAEEVTTAKHLIPLVSEDEVQRLTQHRQQQLDQLDQKIAAAEHQLVNHQGGFESIEAIPPQWGRDAEAELIRTASSPFVNVFPAGAQAVQLPHSPRNLGIRRPLAPHTSQSTQPLYLNLDLRNLSQPTATSDLGGSGGSDDPSPPTGYYRIALDHPQNGYSAAIELFVNGRELAVRDSQASGQLRSLLPLQIDTWYNLQIEVDWQASRFAVTITGGQQPAQRFDSLAFHPDWDGVVNSWVVDAHGTAATDPRPARQLDNFAASDRPFAAADQRRDASLADGPSLADGQWTGVHQAGEHLTDQHLAEVQQRIERLRSQRGELLQQPLYPTICGVQEGTPADAPLQFRGEPDRLGDPVRRGFLTILGGQQLPEGFAESGRRQLADWLTADDNPLLARVMANRVWHYHFGRGIVATPNDFGVRGLPPSHPELLDYLASRFRDEGYSIKSLHRWIVLSRGYRSSSSHDSPAAAIDPDNQLFWRFQRQRLDAESLRDSWLMLSGELDLQPSGPHPFPPMATWRFSQHNPFDAVYPSNKRTVYLMTQRIKRHPFLALFDGADPNATTANRELTTTPAQALYMMNGDFLHERSLRYARRLQASELTADKQIKQLFLEAYGKPPQEHQLASAVAFCQRYANQLDTLPAEPAGNPGQPGKSEHSSDHDQVATTSLAALIRVVLSSNAFLYVD